MYGGGIGIEQSGRLGYYRLADRRKSQTISIINGGQIWLG